MSLLEQSMFVLTLLKTNKRKIFIHVIIVYYLEKKLGSLPRRKLYYNSLSIFLLLHCINKHILFIKRKMEKARERERDTEREKT